MNEFYSEGRMNEAKSTSTPPLSESLNATQKMMDDVRVTLQGVLGRLVPGQTLAATNETLKSDRPPTLIEQAATLASNANALTRLSHDVSAALLG